MLSSFLRPRSASHLFRPDKKPGAQQACSKAQAKYRFVEAKPVFNCFVRNPPRENF